MTKTKRSKKAARPPASVGTGKVTPLQIAFIVDNYLADNNLTHTLHAFRSESPHLFNIPKQVPKGLLGLGEILNDYIAMKEQKLVLDREKRRVEVALQGMEDVIRSYHSGADAAVASDPPPLPPAAAAATPITNTQNVTSTSLSGKTPVMLPHLPANGNIAVTPESNSSYANKRKSLDTTPDVPLAPKKQRMGTISESTKVEAQSSNANSIVRNENNVATSVTDPALTVGQNQSTTGSSCVTKSLFKCQSECKTNKTSTLNGISSETPVVSPVKCLGYYATERNINIISPSKAPNLGNKREHVRGKLDFKDADIPSLEESVAAKTSNLSASIEASDVFDFQDLDFFNGDMSFSELLDDIDLNDKENAAGHLPHVVDPTIERCNNSEESKQHSKMNKFISYSSLSTVEQLPGCRILQGTNTITSVRSITKRVKLVSPAKSKP